LDEGDQIFSEGHTYRVGIIDEFALDIAGNLEGQGGDSTSRFLGRTTDVSLQGMRHMEILEQPEGEEDTKG
jgi:hypothetical protein